jgi:hypothetical protein
MRLIRGETGRGRELLAAAAAALLVAAAWVAWLVLDSHDRIGPLDRAKLGGVAVALMLLVPPAVALIARQIRVDARPLVLLPPTLVAAGIVFANVWAATTTIGCAEAGTTERLALSIAVGSLVGVSGYIGAVASARSARIPGSWRTLVALVSGALPLFVGGLSAILVVSSMQPFRCAPIGP